MKGLFLAILAIATATQLGLADIADFESLPFNGSSDFENGANLTGTDTITNDPFGPSTGSTVTTESTIDIGAGSSVENSHTEKYSGSDGGGAFEFDYWSGWAYSKQTTTVGDIVVDTNAPGYDPANNFFLPYQYASAPGTGAGGSANYGIAYQSVSNPSIEFDPFIRPVSVDITNTVYAALTMQYGDSFASRFGDDPDTTGIVETGFPDWFLLTIMGYDAGDNPTGTVEFYLADFRFADDADDYIVEEWTTVDLSSISALTRRIEFSFTSSDSGTFGPNTPSYVAVDSLQTAVVPEPTCWTLLTVAALALNARRRRNTVA